MKYLGVLPIIAFILLSLPKTAMAFCPVCVIATGAIAGIFRWLGVDDTIIGLWFGGFIFALSIMLSNYLAKKIKTSKALISAMVLTVSYGLTVSVLALEGFFNPHDKIFGVYKIIAGIVFGSLLLFLVPFLNKFLKKQNKGKIFILRQKLIIAICLMLFFSLIFYFLTKYK